VSTIHWAARFAPTKFVGEIDGSPAAPHGARPHRSREASDGLDAAYAARAVIERSAMDDSEEERRNVSVIESRVESPECSRREFFTARR